MRAVPLTTACFALLTAPASGQVCEPGWQPGFGWDPPAEASHAIVTAAPLGREIIFVGGEFTRSVLGEPLSRVASFDGDRWDGLHGGVDGTVRALVAWDPDGAGPQRELVVAAGEFARAGLSAPGGSIAARGVAAWNGRQWAPLGEGISPSGTTLAAIDVDGDGADELFAALGAIVAQFSEGAWQETGWWPAGEIVAHLVPWDRDGAGPDPAWLVGASSQTLRIWNGAQWEQLPPPPGRVSAVAAYDHDHVGPGAPQLIIATDGGYAQYLHVLDGGMWREAARISSETPVRALAPLGPRWARTSHRGRVLRNDRWVPPLLVVICGTVPGDEPVGLQHPDR